MTEPPSENTEQPQGNEPPANNQSPQPSITERLLALGWRWNKQGILVQPEGFEGCKLSEDRDFIGTRYARLSKGEFAYGRGKKKRAEETESTYSDDTPP